MPRVTGYSNEYATAPVFNMDVDTKLKRNTKIEKTYWENTILERMWIPVFFGTNLLLHGKFLEGTPLLNLTFSNSLVSPANFLICLISQDFGLFIIDYNTFGGYELGYNEVVKKRPYVVWVGEINNLSASSGLGLIKKIFVGLQNVMSLSFFFFFDR